MEEEKDKKHNRKGCQTYVPADAVRRRPQVLIGLIQGLKGVQARKEKGKMENLGERNLTVESTKRRKEF